MSQQKPKKRQSKANKTAQSGLKTFPILKHDIDQATLSSNLSILFHAKTLLSLPLGVIAGILGLEGISGVLFFIVSYLILNIFALLIIHSWVFILPEKQIETPSVRRGIGSHHKNPAFPWYLAKYSPFRYLINDFHPEALKYAPVRPGQQLTAVLQSGRRPASFLDLLFPGVRAFFYSSMDVLSQGFVGSFGTFVLIWTLFLNIVYVYH